MAEAEYIAVKFEGNGSRKWDGKESEVPRKTVERLGKKTGEGLEQAEVHWPGKGKGKGKVWKCVILVIDGNTVCTEEQQGDIYGHTAGDTGRHATKRRLCLPMGKIPLERELEEVEQLWNTTPHGGTKPLPPCLKPASRAMKRPRDIIIYTL